MDGKEVNYDSHGAVFETDEPDQSSTFHTKDYIFFGRVEFEMHEAAAAESISTLVLLSDDLDEIDFTTVGINGTIITNFFSKGNSNDDKHGGAMHVHDAWTWGSMHHYAVEWTPNKIEWIMGGKPNRTLLRSEAGEKFPQTPMQVRIGSRVLGYEGAEPGTLEWADSVAAVSNGPSAAIYKNIKVTDYAGGSSATDTDVKEYSYGDRSGSASSIQIKLNDGSTITGVETSKVEDEEASHTSISDEKANSSSASEPDSKSSPTSPSSSSASSTANPSRASEESTTKADGTTPANPVTSTPGAASINGIAPYAIGLVAIVAAIVL